MLNWTKKWSFFLILFLMGIVFFMYTNCGRNDTAVVKQTITVCQTKIAQLRNAPAMLEEMWKKACACEKESALGEKTKQVDDVSEETLQVDNISVGQESVESTETITDTKTKEQERNLAFVSVEEEYFADAVFIGDSRTVGLYEYGGLEEIAAFYASTGLTIYKLLDAQIVELPGQKEKQTIEEALQERHFSKIYLMIGINEMGTGTTDTFMEKYSEVVERIKELQPDAILYLQGIMKVTTQRSEQGDYINNEGIEERNRRISGLTDGEHVFYLDVNPVICDEGGGMEEAYTYDGVHLKAQYVGLWKDFLKSHALVLD